MKAIFTGGGTGGHIYPALAVAQRFRDFSNYEIIYIGSENGMEKKIIEDAGFIFKGIETDGFRSKNPLKNFFVLLKVRRATKVVLDLLKKNKPDFIFATGGYVSAPVVLAAKKLEVPIFLHEQNSIPGLTNKISSKYAKLVFTTFPGSEKFFSKKTKTVQSGLPVRKEFYNINLEFAKKKFEKKPGRKTILITGGSGGASFLNNIALTLYEFAEENNIQIIHVTGKRDYSEVIKKKEEMGIEFKNVQIYSFLPDMYNALGIADLCISRAGASFLSEMTFLGKTGIIIPFPYSANNHQLENAKNLLKKGAIIMVEEKDIKEKLEILKNKISENLFNDKIVEKMNAASFELGVRNTLEIIEDNIIKEIGAKT